MCRYVREIRMVPIRPGNPSKRHAHVAGEAQRAGQLVRLDGALLLMSLLPVRLWTGAVVARGDGAALGAVFVLFV